MKMDEERERHEFSIIFNFFLFNAVRNKTARIYLIGIQVRKENVPSKKKEDDPERRRVKEMMIEKEDEEGNM